MVLGFFYYNLFFLLDDSFIEIKDMLKLVGVIIVCKLLYVIY